MSPKASRRMSNSPEAPLRNGINISSSSSSSAKANSYCRKRVTSIYAGEIKPSILSPAASFLKRLRAQVSKAFSFTSFRRRKHKVSSSAMLSRSRSLAESIESHRAEAVEDCIEFLNSSSFSRSNSVSKTSC